MAAGEDIADRLRARGLSVLNLAHASNSPLIELGSIKEYATRLRPRVILWLYYEGNDLVELIRDTRQPQLMGYLDSTFTQNLIERQPEIDRLYRTTIEQRATDRLLVDRDRRDDLIKTLRLERLRSRLMSALSLTVDPSRNVFYRSYGASGRETPTDSALTLLAEVIDEARRTTTSWNGDFYFVYLPAYLRYRGRMNREDLYHRQTVLELVHRLGIPVIDLHEVFIQEPEPKALFPFGYAGHYTAEGYRLATDAVFLALNDSLTSPQ